MAVYVDDMNAPFRGMIMSHMLADSTEELLKMADTIGVQRKWIQYPNTHREHFDIALSKKHLAIEAGAIEVTWRQIAIMERRRRLEGVLGLPDETEEWYKANGLHNLT